MNENQEQPERQSRQPSRWETFGFFAFMASWMGFQAFFGPTGGGGS